MRESFREVMSQFYEDGVPDDVIARRTAYPERRHAATVIRGMRRTGKTYFAYPVPLRTDSLAVRRTNPDKYYLVDTGMIGALKAKNDAEKGFVLENAVFNVLRRGFNRIEYFNTRKGDEVDFLVTDQVTKRSRLVQVAYALAQNATVERELTALRDARRELRIEDCTVITWEDEDVTEDGIRILPIWKWTLDEEKGEKANE